MRKKEKRKQRSMRRRERVKYIALGSFMAVAIYAGLISRLIRRESYYGQNLQHR